MQLASESPTVQAASQLPSVRILVVTCEWPSAETPYAGNFVVQQVNALRNAGVSVDVFPFRGKQRLRHYLQAWWQLRRRLSSQEYDLIHAHFGQAGLVAAMATRIPVVITYHGSDLYGLAKTGGIGRAKSAVLVLVSKIAALLAREVIVVSPRLQSRLKRRTRVIPMGIDFEQFRPRPRDEARRQLGWPRAERTVLFVANPKETVKRYGLAERAVELAARTIPGTVLRVCCDVPPEHVPIYMNASDVLIVTSAHEGGPLVVREAVACGLPVVSVDVGDVRARMQGIAGCVVCNDDKRETIAAGICSVLQHPHKIDARGNLADLDQQLVVERLLEVYRAALRMPEFRIAA